VVATHSRKSRYPLHRIGDENAEPEAGRPIAVDQSAPQSDPDLPRFQLAPELVTLADTVIDKANRELRELKILYAWDGNDRKSKGRPMLGETRKLGAFQRWLASGFNDVEDGQQFLISINRRQWLAHTDSRWREALLAHQLAAIGKKTDSDGNEVWVVREPDIAEFSEVIERYGLWNQQLANVGERIRQLPLPLTVPTADAKSDTE
jgi:hypothetical protein